MKQLLVIVLLVSVVFSGCSKRPVIYPDDHYRSTGAEKVQHEIDECLKRADDADAAGNLAAEVAKQTGKSVLIGGAAGAAIGAVSGSALSGSLVGIAAGGTVSLLGGLFKGAEDSPVYRRFVEFCLAEKGYQVLGWQ